MVSEKRNNSDNPNETQPITPDGKYTFKSGGSGLGDVEENWGNTEKVGSPIYDFNDDDLLKYGDSAKDDWDDEDLLEYEGDEDWHKDDEGIPFPKYDEFDPNDPTASMNLVNPKYRTYKEEYTRNCQRCYATFELRCRGYDVEAKERILVGSAPSFADDPAFSRDSDAIVTTYGKLRGDGIEPYDLTSTSLSTIISCCQKFISVFDGLSEEMADFTAKFANNKNTETVKKEIEKIVKEGGKGSRYALMMDWRGGGAHICNVVNVGGVPMIYDSQVNCIYHIDEYLSMSKPSSVSFGRIDNKKVNVSLLDMSMKER